MASVVTALAEYADPERYRFSAWFLGRDGPLRDDLSRAGIECAYLPWRGWRDVNGAARAARALRRGRFQIVHRHTGGRSVGSVLRLASGAQVVTHLHGMGAEDGGPPPRTRLRPGTDYVIANSSAHADTHTDGRIPFAVIHPGLRTERFSPRPPAPVGGPPIIGAASRLVPVKGLAHLLDAFAQVGRDVPEARLEIAGDGPERASLERQARSLGIEGSVTFLGWRTDLETVMARWTVFAQPSLEEGFGISALEAMAAGLPVVATSVGGVPDLVVDGVTGRLVPPAEPAAMKAALVAILRSERAAEQMGTAGRRRAIEQFDAKRMVELITDVYEHLLLARGPYPAPGEGS